MTDVHRVEYALDCEGGDRRIYFFLQGRSLQVTVLELRGPEESGPEWSGSTGSLDAHGCEMAVEELSEWIKKQRPQHGNVLQECLSLKVHACLFAWRNTGEGTMRLAQKQDLNKVNVHIESLGDANYLLNQFTEFARLLTRR